MDFVPDVTEILEKLQGIAMEDGEITAEEEALITSIITNLEAYTNLLAHAVSDRVITKAERADLFDQRMQVMDHAYKTAREDQDISEDEAVLLKQVCGIVLEMSKKH